MLGLLQLALDALVIIGIVYVLNEGETPGFGVSIAVSLALSLATFLLLRLLVPLGLFAVLGGLIPLVFIAAMVFWIVFDLTPKRAMTGAGMYWAYKVAWIVIFAILPGGFA